MNFRQAFAAIKYSLKRADWARIANRAVAAATLLSADKTFTGAIPGHAGIVITGALATVSALGPGILKAGGLVRPVPAQDGQAVRSVVQTLGAVVAARKEQKAQVFVGKVADEMLRRTNMLGFAPEQLGKADPASNPGGDGSEVAMGAETLPAASLAPAMPILPSTPILTATTVVMDKEINA